MNEPTHELEAYFAGAASEEQLRAVEAWLNAGRANAKAFMEQLHFREVVGQHIREQANPSTLALTELARIEGAQDVVACVEGVTIQYSSSDTRQRSQHKPAFSHVIKHAFTAKGIAGLAAAAVVLLGVGIIAYQSGTGTEPPSRQASAPLPVVATIESSVDAVWFKPQHADNGELKQGTMLTLESGYAQVTFERGASLIIQGPATFELLSDNAMRLAHGQLTATVPESAHGFAVRTPNALVTDYGTEFGLTVGRDGATHAQTYSGQIGLAYRDGSGEVMLQANEAATVDGLLRPVVFEDLGLMRHEAYQGHLVRPRIDGNLRYLLTLPESLAGGRLEDDRYLLLVPEAKRFDLGALEGEAVYGVAATGKHEVFWAEDQFQDSDNQVALPKAVVDSYLVHYDRMGSPLELATGTGSLMFDRPIVGVITHGSQLHRLDRIIGAEGVQYPPSTAPKRGLEGSVGDENGDFIIISEDRKTLTIRFRASNSVDQIRVFVQASR